MVRPRYSWIKNYNLHSKNYNSPLANLYLRYQNQNVKIPKYLKIIWHWARLQQGSVSITLSFPGVKRQLANNAFFQCAWWLYVCRGIWVKITERGRAERLSFLGFQFSGILVFTSSYSALDYWRDLDRPKSQSISVKDTKFRFFYFCMLFFFCLTN